MLKYLNLKKFLFPIISKQQIFKNKQHALKVLVHNIFKNFLIFIISISFLNFQKSEFQNLFLHKNIKVMKIKKKKNNHPKP